MVALTDDADLVRVVDLALAVPNPAHVHPAVFLLQLPDLVRPEGLPPGGSRQIPVFIPGRDCEMYL